MAPHTYAPVLRRAEPIRDNPFEGPSDYLVLHTMKWGLIPHWNKSAASDSKAINVRSENLVEGSSQWVKIKGKRRCAVVAQGYVLRKASPYNESDAPVFFSYYEWQKKGKERVPHFTRAKDKRLLLFAGLYDDVILEGQTNPLWTFTIVTTVANKEFEWLHDRQPVILSSDSDVKLWLDTSSQSWTKELNQLLDPHVDLNCPVEW